MEKELRRQRNGGGAVEGIYRARRLNCGRRKESVAGSEDHLGGLEDVSFALQLRKELLFMQPAAFVPVVCGVGTGKERCSRGVGMMEAKVR
jgi:hypothetical protein